MPKLDMSKYEQSWSSWWCNDGGEECRHEGATKEEAIQLACESGDYEENGIIAFEVALCTKQSIRFSTCFDVDDVLGVGEHTDEFYFDAENWYEELENGELMELCGDDPLMADIPKEQNQLLTDAVCKILDRYGDEKRSIDDFVRHSDYRKMEGEIKEAIDKWQHDNDIVIVPYMFSLMEQRETIVKAYGRWQVADIDWYRSDRDLPVIFPCFEAAMAKMATEDDSKAQVLRVIQKKGFAFIGPAIDKTRPNAYRIEQAPPPKWKTLSHNYHENNYETPSGELLGYVRSWNGDGKWTPFFQGEQLETQDNQWYARSLVETHYHKWLKQIAKEWKDENPSA